jgi:hypothetical protein
MMLRLAPFKTVPGTVLPQDFSSLDRDPAELENLLQVVTQGCQSPMSGRYRMKPKSGRMAKTGPALVFMAAVLAIMPFPVFPEEEGSAGKIPSLEAISNQVGNPIAVVTWRTDRGNMRFKRAVKCGIYERRFHVEGNKVVFEDRAEMQGDWQEWYKTGENELTGGDSMETVLDREWDWEHGITLYQENIDKTMLIKFFKSDIGGFYSNGDGYLYAYGSWYFIEGKL